ncbi:dolichol-P-glucose synthetase [Bacteroidales bacterium]|nr:dolichol-P-glucose synthetase [Bacteroidales bacterium]
MEIEKEKEVEKIPSGLKKALKIILPLIFGFVVLWMLYRETNFDDMWSMIKDANFGILAFSLLFGLASNIIRAFRWKLLISPLGYSPKTSNLVYAVLGNYAINFVLPRAGEVWRCGVISQKEEIPFSKLLGTLIVDRLFDTIAVALIIMGACILNIGFFVSYFDQNPHILQFLERIFSSVWLYVGIVASVGVVFLIFKIFKESAIIKKITSFFVGIGNGLQAVWKMKQKSLFLLYTLGIWVGYFCYFYITFFAFGFTRDLGIVAGLIVFAMSSLGVAAPTQGGVGAWHFMVISSLVILGVADESARAFAFAVFFIQSLWVILCGIYGIFALSVTKK